MEAAPKVCTSYLSFHWITLQENSTVAWSANSWVHFKHKKKLLRYVIKIFCKVLFLKSICRGQTRVCAEVTLSIWTGTPLIDKLYLFKVDSFRILLIWSDLDVTFFIFTKWLTKYIACRKFLFRIISYPYFKWHMRYSCYQPYQRPCIYMLKSLMLSLPIFFLIFVIRVLAMRCWVYLVLLNMYSRSNTSQDVNLRNH